MYQIPQANLKVPEIKPMWQKSKPNLSVSLFGKPKVNQPNMSTATPQAPANMSYAAPQAAPKQQTSTQVPNYTFPNQQSMGVPAAPTPAPTAQVPNYTYPSQQPAQPSNSQIPNYTFPNQQATPPTTTDGQPHYNVPAPHPIVPINEQMPTLGNRDISKMSLKELQDFKTSLDTAYNRRQTELEGQGRGITLNQIQGQQGVIERIRQGETAGLEAAIAGQKEKEAQDRADRLASIRAGGGSGDNITMTNNPAEIRTNLSSLLSKKGIPVDVRKQIRTALNVMGKLEAMAGRAPGSNFAGSMLGRALTPGFFRGKGKQSFESDEAKLRQDLTSYITGAAYTSLQEKDVNKIIPRSAIRDKQAGWRTDDLYNTMISDLNNALISGGVSYQIPGITSLFEDPSVTDGASGGTGDADYNAYLQAING